MSTPPSLEQWIRDTFARRDETITREDARALLQAQLAVQVEVNERLEKRLHEIEDWKSNLTGRAIAITVLGTILVAVCASVITRLIIG